MRALLVALASLVIAGAGHPVAAADTSPVNGLWTGSVEVKGVEIPFRLDIEVGGDGAARAHFFDGARAATPSADGSLKDGKLHLTFPSYAGVIDATLADGRLDGAYATNVRTLKIHAERASPASPAAGPAPAIGGEWFIPFQTDKGERAWRLIVHQNAGRAEAAILRVDGDTGTLDGVWDGMAFHLSHFAGERPAALTLTPRADHGLSVVLDDLVGRRELTALRPAVATAQGAVPTDPTRHTTLADRTQPFRFAFKDLGGKLVSNADPRFRHKVVVVDVMGSWCPNCHDEAPFLEALYRKHHAEGLEIVALDFEQADQLADPSRLRAFVARYGLTFTVLLAGETKDVNAKLPQAERLNAWPTTFFIGRDGLVKATHAGFTSPGSGARDVETRREVERQVETLPAAKS